MAKRNHPRRGSMAFSPRKRASRTFGHVKSWPTTDASEVRVQGFAGWKAGMTHILARDLNPRSTSAGQEVRVPVTVVECPKMRILGVRGYQMTPYGKQAAGEVWADAEKITEAFPELFKRVPTRKVHDATKAYGKPGQCRPLRNSPDRIHSTRSTCKCFYQGPRRYGDGIGRRFL